MSNSDMEHVLAAIGSINENLSSKQQSIAALMEAIEISTLQQSALKVLLAAVLLDLSSDPQRAQSLAQSISASIDWYSTHAINSRMTDRQVEGLEPHTLALVPEPLQQLVKNLRNASPGQPQ